MITDADREAAARLPGNPERAAKIIASVRIASTEALTARVAELEKAAVMAVMPLEALRISGSDKSLSDAMQQGIEDGVMAVRQALGAKHD